MYMLCSVWSLFWGHWIEVDEVLNEERYSIGNVGNTASMSMRTLLESRHVYNVSQHMSNL